MDVVQEFDIFDRLLSIFLLFYHWRRINYCQWKNCSIRN